MIGANPIYGLNALGGALNIQMKDGFTYQGASLDLMGGSFGRAQTSLQWGKQVGPWGAYIAIEGAHDGGYRKFSASDIRRVYGDIGYKSENAELHLNMGAADNNFGATGGGACRIAGGKVGATSTRLPQSLQQSSRLPRHASANLTLTPTWSLQSSAHLRSYLSDDRPTAIRPTCSLAPIRPCCASTIPPSPANGLTGAQLANPFDRRMRLSARSNRTHTQTTSGGRDLAGHQHRSGCSATTIAFRLRRELRLRRHQLCGASSGTRNAINPDFSVAGSGLFLGPSGDPVSDGPVSLRSDERLYRALRARRLRPHQRR